MTTQYVSAVRDDRVAMSLGAMMAQESPVAPTSLVDILSGSDTNPVSFTSAWETEPPTFGSDNQ
jgi:hypothetical protein